MADRTSPAPPRVGVVGAGILGLAIARRVLELRPDASVTVFDKEQQVGTHQTGHNSGVAHAGLYYARDSLKARLCRRGIELLQAYCEQHRIGYDECGKTVVALSADEVPRLRDIQERATHNGVPGLRWLTADEIREVEPNITGIAALHSPHTAIVDFVAVARAYADDITKAGAVIQLGAEITGVAQTSGSVVLRARQVDAEFDHVVICAGLHADRIARMAGDDKGPLIVPFRGEYLRMRADRADLIRGLVYPVPDPRYPFLGVHFTRRIDGTVDIGPNAVLATSREGYRRRDLNLKDLAETLAWPGFRRLARQHWRMGAKELRGSLSRRTFLEGAREYLPQLTKHDIDGAHSGVRAQALDRDGSLVDDFRISRLGRVTALRNAPSPAATSSLAIAEYVGNKLLEESLLG